MNKYLKEGLRMLRPARTCPNVKRLLLMDPVSFSAASPSFPVACIQQCSVSNGQEDCRCAVLSFV